MNHFMFVCSAPHCNAALDLEHGDYPAIEWVNLPPLVFCGLPHLAAWVQHHAQTGFRDVVKR